MPEGHIPFRHNKVNVVEVQRAPRRQVMADLRSEKQRSQATTVLYGWPPVGQLRAWSTVKL